MEAKVTDRDIERLHFDAQGLVPAVIQDVDTKQVLMLGYMTKQMLAKTLETGQVWFWSRSRREPWLKGATSGNFLNAVDVYRNCEDNSLLILADPMALPAIRAAFRATTARSMRNSHGR